MRHWIADNVHDRAPAGLTFLPVPRWMKRQPGKDMIVFGSGSIVSQLTQHALIDEYQFVVSPIVLGSGRPLFSGLSTSVRLDLLEAKAFTSELVVFRFRNDLLTDDLLPRGEDFRVGTQNL